MRTNVKRVFWPAYRLFYFLPFNKSFRLAILSLTQPTLLSLNVPIRISTLRLFSAPILLSDRWRHLLFGDSLYFEDWETFLKQLYLFNELGFLLLFIERVDWDDWDFRLLHLFPFTINPMPPLILHILQPPLMFQKPQLMLIPFHKQSSSPHKQLINLKTIFNIILSLLSNTLPNITNLP